MSAAIRVERLGKRYRIGARAQYMTLRDDLMDLVSTLLRKREAHRSAEMERESDGFVWALKDVSFEVAQGDVLGIIGRNGVGKSTLLRILSRVTEPTEGQVELHGKVGALLEVGSGFHPELTGRENVFLNGAILGMRRAEIARKFDAIVDFAEVERFIDTPVKRYSSGMHMRLAFAVAAHLEPDILLVDEVLAVGDSAFQAKCLGKMGEVARAGRTVVLVSHNLLAVEGLCNRVIWLQGGHIVESGRPVDVVARYLRGAGSSTTSRRWDDPSTAPGNEYVRLHRAAVRPANGSPSDPVTVRTPFALELEYWNQHEGARLHAALTLRNAHGTVVFEAGPIDEPSWEGRPHPRGLFRDICHVPGDLLNNGTYSVSMHVAKDGTNVLYHYDNVLTFEVLDSVEKRSGWYGEWNGVIRPLLQWTTDLIES